MKKTIISTVVATLLSTTLIAAENSETKSFNPEGFYLGVGGGVTFNAILLSKGYYQDDTATYKSNSLSDTSGGYIVYGGYQFNKIIAVETAYTDYGSFSDTVARVSLPGEVTFTSDPNSLSVYANAGYSFANGLRPFAQIGLGYLMVNGSSSTDAIGIDDSVLMRFGVGLEYAPENFSGFGLRIAYVEDLSTDFSYDSDDNGHDTSTLMMNLNGMLYIGAQYKF